MEPCYICSQPLAETPPPGPGDDRDLAIFYLFQRFLNLPQAALLHLVRGSERPGEWASICSPCLQDLGHCLRLKKKIRELEGQLDKAEGTLRGKLQDKDQDQKRARRGHPRSQSPVENELLFDLPSAEGEYLEDTIKEKEEEEPPSPSISEDPPDSPEFVINPDSESDEDSTAAEDSDTSTSTTRKGRKRRQGESNTEVDNATPVVTVSNSTDWQILARYLPDENSPSVSDANNSMTAQLFQTDQAQVDTVNTVSASPILESQQYVENQASAFQLAPCDRDDNQEDAFCEDFPTRRKRSKVPNKNNWKYESQKMRRMRGEAYIGFAKAPDGKAREIKNPRSGKALGPPCKSKACMKTKFRNCDKFSEEARQRLFQYFWTRLNWEQKRLYVLSLVDQVPKKSNTKGQEASKRCDTFKYHLKLDGERYQICQMMFLNTLGLKHTQVLSWVRNKAVTRKPRSRESYTNRKQMENTTMEAFLNILPKQPSPYGQGDIMKLYLEPRFSTKAGLYKEYKQFSEARGEKPLSQWKLDKLFDKKNLALCQPSKDQ